MSTNSLFSQFPVEIVLKVSAM
jgi:hypothetical protein